MIEVTLIEYLNDVLDCQCYAEIPPNRPDRFVVVQKIDGGKVLSHNMVTFNVECYEKTKYSACDLADEVKTLIFDFVDNADDVYLVTLGGERDNTNASTKEYRYELVFNITYLGG